jgi:5-methylcytosine-specific restriction endonuclease McrA
VPWQQYVPVQGSAPPAFTRRNVFLRDGFCCQYCENKFPIGQLTYDHVIPVSRKGPNAWTNVVTACNYCNGKKGNKLLKDTDMKLKVQPYMPTRYELQRKARQYPPKNLHADWKDYV